MFLYDFITEKYIKSALEEDIDFDDISTSALKDFDHEITANLNTRQDGIFCGRRVFEQVFEIVSSNKVQVKFFYKDGDEIKKGDTLAIIKGSALSILTAERLALNFVQRMSAIATNTRKYAEALKDTNTKIADTRKNTPNFRLFEKYAAWIGGATLHRFNLMDCVMLKDNHIALAGSITKAVEAVRKNNSFSHKIEVECDRVSQVKEALDAGVDIIMLDNMSDEKIAESVALIDKKALIEISGNVTLENIRNIADKGADIISSSALVGKAGTLDLGLDF